MPVNAPPSSDGGDQPHPAEPGGLARRVTMVQQVAERLAAATDAPAVAKAVTAELQQGLGAVAVVLVQLSEDGASFSSLAAEGVSDRTRELLTGPVATDDWRPARTAVTGGRPVLWSTPDERDRAYPELVGYGSRAQSWALLPLTVRGSAIGLLSIGWSEPRDFPDVETAILEVVAHQCAMALDRAGVEAVRQAERQTLELLGEGTRVMVSALEPAAVIDALVDLAVPRLAPWCAVYVAEGRTLRRVAVRYDGDEVLAGELRGRAEQLADDMPPLDVAFAGTTLRVASFDEAAIRARYAPSHAERLLARSRTWTVVLVPVQAGGQVLGVMSLGSDRWPGTPPDEVRFAAEELAARAGVALVNARRFTDERQTAAMLMQAFLPASIPDVPGYDVSALYLPAGARVAGDWYDVARLPTGEYLVGIGDAGGHGIAAASLMGQLRNTARGLAMTGHPPAVVVDALRTLTAEDGAESFATALYAVLDPAGHTARWAAGGHLPPLVRSGGGARYVDRPPSPPLGCPAPPATELDLHWERGSGVVLVTDGVVERRDAAIDDRMERLRALVAGLPQATATELTSAIADELCAGAEDDCCVVVVLRD